MFCRLQLQEGKYNTLIKFHLYTNFDGIDFIKKSVPFFFILNRIEEQPTLLLWLQGFEFKRKTLRPLRYQTECINQKLPTFQQQTKRF